MIIRFHSMLVIIAWLLSERTSYGQSVLSASQSSNLYFNTIGKTEGLTSGKVRSIMQDKRGFIYLCTTAGIERFDGYSLSHFQLPGNPEMSALMDEETRACLQDKQGRFWIITDFNGLFVYDPANGKADRFLHDQPATLYLIDFILDRSGKYLWIATNDGFIRFGLADGKTESFLKGKFFLTVFQDRNGGIWAGTTDAGIYFLDPDSGKTDAWLPKGKSDRKSFPGYYCRSIAQDVNGDMLFAADNGFFRMNLQTKKTKGYFNQSNTPGSYPGSNTSSLRVDSRGRLWVGTFGSGLVLFDRHHELFSNYQRHPNMVGSLAGNYIESLYEDAAGQIWVGDHTKGVSYFNGNIEFIHKLQMEEEEAAPLKIKNLNCLFTNNDKIWMGLQNGMAAYSNTTGRFSFFTLDNTAFQNCKEVTALLELPSGDLAVGTQDGVLKFNPTTGKYARLLPASLDLNSQVLYMMLEGDSAIWLSTTDGKLWRASLGFGKVRRFEQEGKLPQRPECNVLFQTKSGRLCFGSYGGFDEYDEALDTFISNRVPGYYTKQGNAVADIGEDEFGTIWIARYGGGLDAFDPQTKRYRHFGLEEGLPDLFCLTVQPDNYGHLWVGTENGLVVFAAQKEVFDSSVTLHFKVFDTKDGLASNQTSCSATLIPNDPKNVRQTLYFGSEEGLTEVRPELLEFNSKPPKPTLSAFFLFNHLLTPSDKGILKLPIEETTSLTLPPKQNFFTLEFSALNLLSPEKNRYRYLLDGYDPDWVDAGNKHTANYTNVPPGNYVFRLVALNNDGIISQSQLAININLLPAWYQTWWFTALIVAIVFLAAFGYFHWRLGQLRKMEAMRQSIAADLHDEVGASLTSIQILAQLASHPDPGRRTEALGKLPEQVRRTSASLREIVWNINPKGDALDLLIGELTRHAGEVFEKSDIEYTVQTDDFPDNAILESAARQHLVRIFKEILNNIAKHSHASRAAVFFKKEKVALTLVVRDNGLGFDPITIVRGNGLDNMQQRAAAVGGQFQLRSNPTDGTEIELRMPFKQKRNWWPLFGRNN